MPKIVDHSQKRREIIQATWRLVASRGFEAATMRQIAAEAGYANGALSHYFANKEELLRAAYIFVWEETNARIGRRLADLQGLDALRIYWEEISPSSDVTRLEAKIVLPFFARAAADPTWGEINAQNMNRWRDELTVHLRQARSNRQIIDTVPVAAIVEHLLNMLMGLQILAVVAPTEHDIRVQRSMFDQFLALLTR